MIIVNFSGGLGNQMFQYALYKSLERNNKKVKANIGYYKENYQHNGFELDRVFNLKMKYANEVEQFQELKFNYIEELIKDYFSFQKNILDLDNAYLKGYWQNEKYFENNKELLLKEFRFKVDDSRNLELVKEIEESEAVSIHIRRGDYLNCGDLFIEVATLDYYKSAIEIIKSKIENSKFFIFSDDFKWVKEFLKIENSVYVDFNIGEDSYKDMFLMSKCKHNIIANSTFSWWAAWLNRNIYKIVIRPDRIWNTIPNGESIYCNEWINGSNSSIIKEIKKEDNFKKNYLYEKLNILKNLFNDKKYEMIKQLHNIEDECVYYYMLRISIIQNYEQGINDYFEKFINKIETKDDEGNYQLYISAIFYFGKYNFDKKNYKKAKKMFEELNYLTNGSHHKAQEYLEQLRKIQ